MEWEERIAMTVREAARACGVRPIELERFLVERGVTITRVGRKRLVRTSDVVKHLGSPEAELPAYLRDAIARSLE